MFNAIERFSEDIDVILDWKLLGYKEGEAWEARSATQQDKFGKEAGRRTAIFLETQLAPTLKHALKERLKATDTDASIEVTQEDQNILLQYPKAFSLEGIQPQVRLELGPMAEAIPNELRRISPFAAEEFPTLFTQKDATVRTILAERTFWEKATILHQEAHRDAAKSLPPRYSRHYYDLHRLSRLPLRKQAIEQIDLLLKVAAFKNKFYRCAWARYEEARPGTLRLLPPDHHLDVLRRDYKAMQSMLYGSIPTFDEIITGLSALEAEINSLRKPTTSETRS